MTALITEKKFDHSFNLNGSEINVKYDASRVKFYLLTFKNNVSRIIE